jgi:hypothetical protein
MTNPLDLAVSLRRSGSKTYNITGNVNTGGGAEKISDLEDVDLTGILDGYILVYNAANEEWVVEPKPVDGVDGATGPAGPAGADGATGPAGPAGADGADGANTVADLTDVDLTGLADNYILVYDTATSKWLVEAKPTGGSGDVTAITTRAVATITSASSIAAGAQTQFNAAIDGKAVRLYTVETNVEMRVRIYTDSTSATADASRPIGTDPATNSGCLFEFVTTPSLLISKLSPLVDIFSSNTNQEEFTFILTNLSSSSSILEVDFIYITQEL